MSLRNNGKCPHCGQPWTPPPSLAERVFPKSRFIKWLSDMFDML